MVVTTRSRSRSRSQSSSIRLASPPPPRRQSRINIQTPSFRDANIHTYKIYTGSGSGSGSGSGRRVMDDDASAAAAAALVEISTVSADDTPAAVVCINPMHPISQYIYHMNVFRGNVCNRSAFILYNKVSRLFHVYSIISNDSDSDIGNNRPTTMMVHAKFKSYISETIITYINTLMTPPFPGEDVSIQEQILGIVMQTRDLEESAFHDESTYYDIEKLLHDDSSPETVNGRKIFPVIPQREYSYSQYTPKILDSVLLIIGQSV